MLQKMMCLTDTGKLVFNSFPTTDVGTTLTNVVQSEWEQLRPDVPFPSIHFILNEFTKVNGDWQLFVYHSVRNDFNGFLSGVIPISECLLAHEPFENEPLTSNVMKLTHVFSKFMYQCTKPDLTFCSLGRQNYKSTT